jgi:hypothetical protein
MFTGYLKYFCLLVLQELVLTLATPIFTSIAVLLVAKERIRSMAIRPVVFVVGSTILVSIILGQLSVLVRPFIEFTTNLPHRFVGQVTRRHLNTGRTMYSPL